MLLRRIKSNEIQKIYIFSNIVCTYHFRVAPSISKHEFKTIKKAGNLKRRFFYLCFPESDGRFISLFYRFPESDIKYIPRQIFKKLITFSF